jgi:menaquinone-9 beta-reductase
MATLDHPRYDVAVVGASIAGCTAATFFARRGLQVALIEQTEDPRSFKKVCTHFIQSSATPTIQRLRVASEIEEAGGIRNGVELWTRWGWIRFDTEAYGYNIRRQKLDPLLRTLATNTPGVDYFPAREARELLPKEGRVRGIGVLDRSGRREEIDARLVVGADGRNSRVAEMSGLPTEAAPNNRFVYFAYFRNVHLTSGRKSQTWLIEPDLDIAYAMPVDDGLTLLAAMPLRPKLDRFRGNLEQSFASYFEALPDGPNMKSGERVSEFRGMLDIPNLTRAESRPGLALIGDAALASDPSAAVGCGWALQSAEWLVDSTAEALAAKDDALVDAALGRYSRTHTSRLSPHQAVISSFSTGRPYNRLERMLYKGATSDPVVSSALELLISRKVTPEQALTPSVLTSLQRISTGE